MNIKVSWIVDQTISEREYDCGYPSLLNAAIEAGHHVSEAKYIPFERKIKIIKEHKKMGIIGPIIAHGTIEFIRECKKKFPLACPLAYQNENVTSFEKFAVPLRDYLLNDDYLILPYKEIKLREEFKRKSFFIKPLSGLKQFTGKVIVPENFEHEINSLNRIERIDDDLLCVVSSSKYIESEFRYIICDGKVITGSEYRWDNKLDIRIDTLPECDKLAEIIAKHEFQADYVYVCDIAMTGDGPKVIELNSFSSSGLYACDTRKIIEEVSKMAIKEYNGDI